MSLEEDELPVVRDSQPNQGFPKALRLLKRKEFDKVYQTGNKIITKVVIFRYAPSDQQYPRLGLTVSRRVGNAVIRNKIKRRIREAFRMTWPDCQVPVDLVASPRRGATEKNFEDYLQSFAYLYRKLNRTDVRGER